MLPRHWLTASRLVMILACLASFIQLLHGQNPPAKPDPFAPPAGAPSTGTPGDPFGSGPAKPFTTPAPAAPKPAPPPTATPESPPAPKPGAKPDPFAAPGGAKPVQPAPKSGRELLVDVKTLKSTFKPSQPKEPSARLLKLEMVDAAGKATGATILEKTEIEGKNWVRSYQMPTERLNIRFSPDPKQVNGVRLEYSRTLPTGTTEPLTGGAVRQPIAGSDVWLSDKSMDYNWPNRRAVRSEMRNIRIMENGVEVRKEVPCLVEETTPAKVEPGGISRILNWREIVKPAQFGNILYTEYYDSKGELLKTREFIRGKGGYDKISNVQAKTSTKLSIAPPPKPPIAIPATEVGKVKWKFPVGPIGTASPTIGPNGTVYFGSEDNKVYAVNGTTGKKIWEFATGNNIGGTPSVGPDGTVYIGSDDMNMYALNGDTGEKIWEFKTGSRLHSNAAIGADGTIYFGSMDKKVYALNGKTGKKIWEFKTGGQVWSSPAIGTDGTVYVGSNDKKVYALNGKTGEKTWEFPTGGLVWGDLAIGKDGTVYFGSADSNLYAVNGRTGEKLWQFNTGKPIISPEPVIGPDGTIYIGNSAGNLFAIDRLKGTRKWEYKAGIKDPEGNNLLDGVQSTAAIAEDGTVYITGAKKVHAVDGRTGNPIWTVEAEGLTYSSPVIGPDGTVYFGAYDGTLYAIQGSAGPDTGAPWPMRGNNAHNTARTGDTHTPKKSGRELLMEVAEDSSFAVKPNIPDTPDSRRILMQITDAAGKVTEARINVRDGLLGKSLKRTLETTTGKFGINFLSKPGGVLTLVYSRTLPTGASEPLAPAAANLPLAGSDLWLSENHLDFGLQKLRPIKSEMRSIRVMEKGVEAMKEIPCLMIERLPFPGKVIPGSMGRIVEWHEIVRPGQLGNVVHSEVYDPGGQLLKVREHYRGNGWFSKITNVQTKTSTILSHVKQPATHDYASSIAKAAIGRPRWVYKTFDKLMASPAVGDGTVYVASTDNNVYALGPNGRKKWTFSTGNQVVNSPAVGLHGYVFVGSDDFNVYAINAKTGEKAWEFATGAEVRCSPAISLDKVIYIGSADKKLYALDGPTGTKAWEFETGGAVISSPAIGVDGTVYFGSYDRKVYALDGKTGKKIWEFETGDKILSSPAIGEDGTVYIGSFDRKVYALDGRTGKKIWEFETGDKVLSSPVIGGDGTVYIGSHDSNLYALNGRTGAKKWEFLTGAVASSAAAVGADGILYYASGDRKVYAIDARTGKPVWSHTMPVPSIAPPTIGPDGTVYISSLDGTLHAMQGSVGPAAAPWPMFGQSARHLNRAGLKQNPMPLAPGPLETKWAFSSHGLIVGSPALGGNGMLYIGSADKNLYAINRETGMVAWSAATEGEVQSSPAIGPDGTVYVGSHDHKLHAFNGSTGKKLWEFETGDQLNSSPAVGPDGTVYIGSDDDKVYAVNGSTGQKLWEFPTGDDASSSPSIGPDGTVYIGSGDHKLYALNGSTGQKIWEFETGDRLFSSPAIGADGTIYFGSRDHKVYAVDGKTGIKKWEYVTGDIVRCSPTIGPDGTVYIGSFDHKVYALDGKTGTKTWDFDMGSPVMASPTVANLNSVVVLSLAGRLLQLDTNTGKRLEEYKVGAPAYSSPAVDFDGTHSTWYLGGDRNKLLALKGTLSIAANAPWPMFGQNVRHTRRVGEVPFTQLPKPKRVPVGQQKWAYQTGGPIHSSSPAISADGTVYVGSKDNKLHAFKGSNGRKLWEFETGGAINSSPAIGADGTVYFGSFDDKVYALNGRTGEKLWEFQTGGDVEGTPAIDANGAIFIGSIDRKLYKLDGWTGKKLWEFETGDEVFSMPAIGTDGTVYFGSRDKKLYALNGETGEKLWEFLTGGPVTEAASPALGADDIVYIASYDKKVYALNGGNGKKLWEFLARGDVGQITIGPAGNLYVGSGNSKTYALDGKTGKKLWESQTGVAFSSAVGNGNTVYQGSWDKKIHALNGKTGARKWEFLTGEKLYGSCPAIGPDGTIYIGSEDGKIYAIQGWSPSLGVVPGPADSPWPMLGQNARNTGRVGDAQNPPLPDVLDSTDNNPAPTDILLSAKPVPENEPAGTTVGTFTLIDTDKVAMAPPPRPGLADISKGLLGYWPLDDGQGNSVADLTGNGNNGTVHSPAPDMWVAGRFGKALRFDGVQRRVEIPHIDKYLIKEGSFALWYRHDNNKQKGFLFAKDSGAGKSHGQVYLDLDQDRLTMNLQCSTTDHLLNIDKTATGLNIANQWHHAVATFGPNGMKIYLDGKPVASNKYKDGLGFPDKGNGNKEPVVIGANTLGKGNFKGFIDEFRLYDRALSGQEVLALRQLSDESAMVAAAPALNIDPATIGKQKWAFKAGGKVKASPAVGEDGTVYVGSGKVYAVDGETGLKAWEFAGGGAFTSSPAIGPDGTVYIGSWDMKVYALDGRTGNKIWEFETGGAVEPSPAIGIDGNVYIGSDDGKVYALDGKTGAKIWEFETGAPVESSPAIGWNGTVYVGGEDNKVHALDARNGAKIWEFETGGDVYSSPSIGAYGTIYVGSDDKKVYALHGGTGAKKWEFETGGMVRSSPTLSSIHLLYVGSNDNKVYALDKKTGAKIWEFETGGWVESSPAVGKDGTVYVGSKDGKVYALEGRTGAKIWELATGMAIGKSSPAIGPDGTLYIGSNDGNLYAIQGSSRPAKGPWPMRGQNMRRTASAQDKLTNLEAIAPEEPAVAGPGTFELVPGEGDTDNAFFTIEEETLKLAAPLDFETKQQYSLRVRGTDPGDKSIEKAFLVEVTDVLEDSTFSVNLDGRDDLIAVDRRDGKTLVNHADLTLMSWVKVTADTVEPPSILSIPRNPGEAVDGGTPGVFNLSTSLGGQNIPGVRFAIGDNEVVDVISIKPLPQDFWAHIAVTIKSGGTARLYINGEPDATVDLAGRSISWGNVLNPLYVGSNAINRGFLPGFVDDVRIYSRELTEAEIKGIFMSRAPLGIHGSGPKDEFLQLHLVLEEGKGNQAGDHSKYNRTAILLNGVAWSRDNPGFPFVPVRRKDLGAFIIVSIDGQIQVDGLDGKPLPPDQVAPGRLLLQGQTVHTGPKGSITLLLSNGSTTTLKPMTGMVLGKLEQKKFVLPATTKLSDLEAEPSTSKTELKLGYGDLIFNVKKLNKGSHFLIESPVGMAAIRGTSGQLSVRIDPVTQVATGAVNMATGTVEFQDKEEEIVEVPAGKAVQVQATAEGEKVGEVKEYVAPPIIVEEIRVEVLEIETVTEQVVIQFVTQAVEETQEKVAEAYGIEFREFTDPRNRVITAHIWKVQGGLVFLELESGRLIKTPITNFSVESQAVLRNIRPVIIKAP